MNPAKFNAEAKEAALRQESQSWDIGNIQPALAGDIPTIDIQDYRASGSASALEQAAAQLGKACRQSGFYHLVGHGLSKDLLADVLAQARCFHELPQAQKMTLAMDDNNPQPAGTGFLPYQHNKLPKRDHGNKNEAYLIKRDHRIALTDNPWPQADWLPTFQTNIMAYAKQLETLALSLLPLYARALQMPADFFAPAFQQPFYRLRLTRYPAAGAATVRGYGIAPHVDTTFFTLLLQDGEGLRVYSERRQCWIAVPYKVGGLVVNTGELLKQWSNDEFISVKHFADNPDTKVDRYSVPFFFNATANYPMACIPSCCSAQRPARYPTISYDQSQGVIQGE